ncbi:MAG: hypothetical protein HY088_05655 [Ignavibacteriales bacterium]|nr:hypothetical protein [Ignavibacteriales bacterium]
MESIIKEIDEMTAWVDACYKRSDLHEFNTLMQLGVETGNHLRKLAVVTFGSMTEEEAAAGEETFELHDAVIVGHMVRIYKLYDQLVYFVGEDKGEIASIFSRLLFETYVIMKYLIVKGNSSIDNFIKISFKSTIKQYDYLKGIEAQRRLTEIETRIIQKIENRLDIIGLDASVLSANKSWRLDGLSFKGIVDYLSQRDSNSRFWALSYDFLYSNMSSFIHGLWYDLETNHLDRHGDRYSPKGTYDRVDPRYILPASLIPVIACKEFLAWRRSDPDNFLTGVLDKIFDLLMFLNEMDEIRIGKRSTT